MKYCDRIFRFSSHKLKNKTTIAGIAIQDMNLIGLEMSATEKIVAIIMTFRSKQRRDGFEEVALSIDLGIILIMSIKSSMDTAYMPESAPSA
jgi:hypothetical protein